MKAKKLVALFLALTLTLGITACGNSSTTPSGGSQTNGSGGGKGTTITYAIWDKNQEPGMRAIADAFEAQNPGIKVKVEVTGWDEYWTKLEAGATGGVLPDAFWMHINNFRKYADAAMLEPITEGVDMSKFPEGLVDLYTVDGTSYAVPKDFDTIGLWYNKTMFDEKGIPYPDESWDWDKAIEVAKQLTDPSAGVFGLMAGHSAENQQGFYNLIFQNGGHVISEDKKSSGYDLPETIEAVQVWHDLIHEHKVSPPYETLVESSASNLFTSGRVAMVMLGSWMVTELKNNEYSAANADVAVLPQMKQRATVYNGLGNAVSAKSPNKEAALKFVQFTGTEEANLLQAEHVSAIPAYEGTQQPWIDSITTFNVGKYVDMLEYAYIYPTSKTRPRWDVAENDYMRQILSGQLGVEEGCKALASEMNAILADE
ncbi:ABC transporter substrate-binding protein [Anaerotalea alkaliphila]|uniref:Sugar ABC transporter substrate-binding protein n=1 Tax=Anaerotalea alkaliphila TaxID=2662126 RepID=A0A7X5KL11_9FIRM|nr:sugar ABC transporter substrate-binding protein [Anaerotalea alkaliphila]NDL66346.1 sugar ABC transporter substrate-binding protein [Anaerotalea alkaliphila]